MVCEPNDQAIGDAFLELKESSETRTMLFARSEKESVDDYLWRLLHGGKLAGLHFRRNQIVDGFVAPFYCKCPGLVIEVENESENEPASHIEREKVFARHGLRTLRIECESVIDRPADTLQKILRTARAPGSIKMHASRGNR